MIIVIHGEDTFQSRHLLRRVLAEHKNVERFDEESTTAEVRAALGGATLFADKRCVVLESAKANEDLIAWLSEKGRLDWLGKSDDTTLVLFEPTSVASHPFYKKAIRRASNTYAAKKLTESEKVTWFGKMFAGNNVTVSRVVVAEVVRLCRGDMWRAYNELTKLIQYADNEPTLADVKNMVVGDEEAAIFPLLDALFAGKADSALRDLQLQWRSGEAPQGVFAMIERQLKIVALVKEQLEGGKQSPQEIAGELGLHPFVVTKTMQASRRYSWPKIRELYRRVESLDSKSKTGALDPYLACELLASAVAS